jgi:hypothetical protein
MVKLGIAKVAALLALAAVSPGAAGDHWQPPLPPVPGASGPACYTVVFPGTMAIDARPGRVTVEPRETQWFGVRVHSKLSGCPQFREIEVCAKTPLRAVWGRCQVIEVESGHDRLTAFGVRAGRREGHFRVRFTARVVYPDLTDPETLDRARLRVAAQHE